MVATFTRLLSDPLNHHVIAIHFSPAIDCVMKLYYLSCLYMGHLLALDVRQQSKSLLPRDVAEIFTINGDKPVTRL